MDDDDDDDGNKFCSDCYSDEIDFRNTVDSSPGNLGKVAMTTGVVHVDS